VISVAGSGGELVIFPNTKVAFSMSLLPTSFAPALAYIVINLDPIAFRLGPIAVHWYGLAYVVAIAVGMFVLLRWTRRHGIHDDQIWSLFLWAALGGLIGARLYFVIQQPNLVQDYLLNPINIIAVWNGGLAFFGAIFGACLVLFFLAPRVGIDRWLVLDGGALFAAVGQIFGRFGNIVNGDILGNALSLVPITVPANVCPTSPCVGYVSDPNFNPLAFVYTNPASFAPNNIPFLPAPLYEITANLVTLAILWPLRYRLPKRLPGLFFVLYLALYSIGQFIVFFLRGSEPTIWGTPLKQAQWTAIFTFLLCIPLLLFVLRTSRRWPFSVERPIPWPLPAGGFETAYATALEEANTAQRKPIVVRKKSGSAQTRPETPAIELPPWEPHRPTGGALRNQFGAS
jgi:phosphatidylglycerol:prolipoprotein diacylglycerol transferase